MIFQRQTWFGPWGDELGFDLRRVAGLGPAVAHVAVDGAQQRLNVDCDPRYISPVQQRGPHLRRGGIGEAFAVQHSHDLRPLPAGQCRGLGPVGVQDRDRPTGGGLTRWRR